MIELQRADRDPCCTISPNPEQVARIFPILAEVTFRPAKDTVIPLSEVRHHWAMVIQQVTPWYQEGETRAKEKQIGWQIWSFEPMQAEKGVRVFDPELMTFKDIGGVVPEPNDILRTTREGSFLGKLVSAEVIKPLQTDYQEAETILT